jgi:hypothetical protein
MKVKIEVKNKDLEIVDVEVYEFKDYFDYLATRTKSLLYQTEDYKIGLIGHDLLRKSILDLAGHIQRLPETLKFDDEEVS